MRQLILGGALAIALPAIGLAQPAPPPAADYVAMAGQSDLFEIKSGQLAEAKAMNPAIKKFGQKMVDDHTKSTNLIMGAVKADGMQSAPPASLSSDQQAMLGNLKSASGEAFDKAYVAQQLKAHQDALALQSGYAEGGDDPKLKAVAGQIVPVVKSHLAMLQSME